MPWNRYASALAMVIGLLCGNAALAQSIVEPAPPAEVVELLRSGTNLRQLIERSLETPGADWRHDVVVERQRLEALLRSSGYLDGRLQLDVAAGGAQGQNVTVRVEPGERYRIASVDLAGGAALGAGADSILAQSIGKVASAANAETIASQLLWELGEQGHPFARVVERAFAPLADPGQAVLRLVVQVPPPSRFDRLEIEGRGASAAWKIEAQLPFAKGDLYSGSRLAAFREAVAKESGGGSVRVDAEPGPDGTFILRARFQRSGTTSQSGVEMAVGVALLLATLLTISQRRVMLGSTGPGIQPKLTSVNLAVAALLLVSAIFVLGRALSFLSGSA